MQEFELDQDLELDFDDYLAEKLKDPAFKAEYDALTPEYEALKAKIERDIRRRAARAKKDRSSQTVEN